MSYNLQQDSRREEIRRIKLEARKYTDILSILTRLEQQGKLSVLIDNFTVILEEEKDYTLKELKKYEKMVKNNEDFEIYEHFVNNSHIFKQNLILIVQIIIDDIWRRVLLDVKNSESTMSNGHETPKKDYEDDNGTVERPKTNRSTARKEKNAPEEGKDSDPLANSDCESVVLNDISGYKHYDTSDLVGNDPFIELDEEDDDNKESLISSDTCLLYTSPSPRDGLLSRMPSSA
eukprot:TRINITY_DN9100_c0_g1_i2.p1 TRINITY_DN9100_c0_g1~~TRINITY_DN9100_c0_g1_i2.p1  ORF type:complete len:233 (-),score=49.91 TRINITY_DN9100_c0_g1_i2:43-741(-)